MVGSLLAPASEAAASGVDLGAKFANLTFVDAECAQDGTGCIDDVGVGEANTIYVRQTKVDGEWRYDTVEGAGADSDDVWLQVEWHGGCNSGYRLLTGGITQYDFDGHGWWSHYVNVNAEQDWFGLPKVKAHSTERTMQVPITEVLSTLLTTSTFITSTEGILDHAEGLIEHRMSEGMTETEARAVDSTIIVPSFWSGVTVCKGMVLGSEYYESQSHALPLRIVFEGAEPMRTPTGPNLPAGDGFQLEAAVLDAWTVVTPDENDVCKVNVNGFFETNTATELEYYIANQHGQYSDVYSVDVGPSGFVEVHHQITIPAAEEPMSPFEAEAIPDAHDGQYDDWAPLPTDNVSDVLQFIVVSPQYFEASVDGYSMPPCDYGIGRG